MFRRLLTRIACLVALSPTDCAQDQCGVDARCQLDGGEDEIAALMQRRGAGKSGELEASDRQGSRPRHADEAAVWSGRQRLLGRGSPEEPILYVSFHSPTAQIYAFNLTSGENTSVLEDPSGRMGTLHNLRGFAFYRAENGTMFAIVANAYKEDSHLITFAMASATAWVFDSNLTSFSEDQNPGLRHPYGIVRDAVSGTIFVSAQDTEAVLRYSPSGTPEAFASGTVPPYSLQAPFPGCVAYFGYTGGGGSGVRGMAMAPKLRLIFTAQQVAGPSEAKKLESNYGTIYALDTTDGALRYSVPAPFATDLWYDEQSSVLYAAGGSSKGKGCASGAVYKFVIRERGPAQAAGEICHEELTHAGSLAVLGGVLYVCNQDKMGGSNAVLMFDVYPGGAA